jgi:protein disulfide-isomerase A6
MKPAWDELGEEYSSSSSVIIGDVDCTADDTKEICDAIGVKGYPTVKYFTSETPETGEAYNGGRSINDLKTFVEETLSKRCDIADTLTCSDQEVAYIEKMRAKSGDDVAKELKRLDDMLKSAKMAADKKTWMVQRLAILKQM